MLWFLSGQSSLRIYRGKVLLGRFCIRVTCRCRELDTSGRAGEMSTPEPSAELDFEQLKERYDASQRANAKLTKNIAMYKERAVNIAALVSKYHALEHTHSELQAKYSSAAAELEQATAVAEASKAKASSKSAEVGPLKSKLTRESNAKDAVAAKLKASEAELKGAMAAIAQEKRRATVLAQERDELAASASDATTIAREALAQVQDLREEVASLKSGSSTSEIAAPGTLAAEVVDLQQQVAALAAARGETGTASADSDSSALHRLTLSSVQHSVRELTLQQGAVHSEMARWKSIFGALAGSGGTGRTAPASREEENTAAPLSSCMPTSAMPARSSSGGRAESAAWEAQRLTQQHLSSTQCSSDGARPVVGSKRRAASGDVSVLAATAAGGSDDAPRPTVARRLSAALAADAGKAPAERAGPLQRAPAPRAPPVQLLVEAAPLPRRQSRRIDSETRVPPRAMMQLGSQRVRSSAHAGTGFVFSTAEESARWARVQHCQEAPPAAAASTAAAERNVHTAVAALFDDSGDDGPAVVPSATPCEPAPQPQACTGPVPSCSLQDWAGEREIVAMTAPRACPTLSDLERRAPRAMVAALHACRPLAQRPVPCAAAVDAAKEWPPAEAASKCLALMRNATELSTPAACLGSCLAAAASSDGSAAAAVQSVTAAICRCTDAVVGSCDAVCDTADALWEPWMAATSSEPRADAETLRHRLSFMARSFGASEATASSSCRDISVLVTGSASATKAVASDVATSLDAAALSRGGGSAETHVGATFLFGCSALLRAVSGVAAVERSEQLGTALSAAPASSMAALCTHGHFLVAPCSLQPVDDASLRAFWATCDSRLPQTAGLGPLAAMETAVRLAAAQQVAAATDAAARAAGERMLAWGAQRWGWPQRPAGVVIVAVARSIVATLRDAADGDQQVLAAVQQLADVQATLQEMPELCADASSSRSDCGSASSSDDEDDSSSASDSTGTARGALAQFADEAQAALVLAAHACGWRGTAELLLDSVVWSALEEAGVRPGCESLATLMRMAHALLGVIQRTGAGCAVAEAYVAETREALAFFTY